ncbi:MAG TPA: ABC transporter permease, partial [Streptosporangiaceae bacterium]
ESVLPGAPPSGTRRLEWLNWKLTLGASMVLAIVLVDFLGPVLWNTRLARPASSPPNLPPVWEHAGTSAHLLGTESLGRDVLALLIVGAPASLRVGAIAAAAGLAVAMVLGFVAGYVGGWLDDVVRVLADAWVTIPALAVMVVLAAAVSSITTGTEAFLLALFSWPMATRMLRSQMLSMRGRGYVKMARLSGVSSFKIMFAEILPNMIPYLVASFVSAMAVAILAATSLEALGLGPSQTPTLGLTIYYAIQGSALLRGMWWWWGLPVLLLVIIFSGLFILSIGLDEVANPRLKRYGHRAGRPRRRPARPAAAAAGQDHAPAAAGPAHDASVRADQ